MNFERRVLVLEDDDFVRGLVADALAERGFAVQSATNVLQAMEVLEDWDPDALITDIHLGPGPTGAEFAFSASRLSPGMAILAISNYPDAVAAGVGSGLPEHAGFVCKADLGSPHILVDALEAVLASKPDLIRREDRESPIDALTPDQVAVLRLIAEGWSNAAIAEQRGSTVRSAEQMVHRVFVRLGIDTDPRKSPRVQATKIYSRAFGVPLS